jgi:hypothetical protein
MGISFEPFTAMIVRVVASFGSYNLAVGYQSFGGKCCLNLQGINKHDEDAYLIYSQITRKVVTPVQVRNRTVLISTLKMVAKNSSEIPVSTYKITWCHNIGDHKPNGDTFDKYVILTLFFVKVKVSLSLNLTY